MCLILFSYKSHPDYRLIVAANRDEFYNRPTQPLSYWSQTGGLLAGRDLTGGGTWLGITPDGRFAAVTNYREPEQTIADPPTRGHLVSEYLTGSLEPGAYLAGLQAEANRYRGFNLIVGNPESLHYYSNRGEGAVELQPGIYGLSNHLINTPWPKVEKGRAMLNRLGPSTDILTASDELLMFLKDPGQPADDMLPDTGVGLEWERILSPVFINSETYGTRSSSVIWMDYSGQATFFERSYHPRKNRGMETEDRVYEFQMRN